MIDEPNGILAKIPGQYIAAGSNSLPVAGRGQLDVMEALVDAGYVGLVRIRYRLRRSTHGKSVNWYWLAVYAEPA